MKKMQLITFAPNYYSNMQNDIDISNFNNLKSLDNYEINIFDLTNFGIWKNIPEKSVEPELKYFLYLQDFLSINTMIRNSQKSKIDYLSFVNTKFILILYHD